MSVNALTMAGAGTLSAGDNVIVIGFRNRIPDVAEHLLAEKLYDTCWYLHAAAFSAGAAQASSIPDHARTELFDYAHLKARGLR